MCGIITSVNQEQLDPGSTSLLKLLYQRLKHSNDRIGECKYRVTQPYENKPRLLRIIETRELIKSQKLKFDEIMTLSKTLIYMKR